MRLRTTLFGLLVIVALVLSGTVYAGFSLHKDDVVRSERTSLNATAESLAENIDTRIEEKRTMIRLAAANPAVVPGITVGGRNESVERFAERTDKQDVVERFVARSAYDGASIIDEEGIMRAIDARNLSTVREHELVGSNFSHRAYVQQTLAGSTYVGDPVRADSGNHVVTISAPIERDGAIVGLFTGALHLERSRLFTDLSTTLEPGQTVQVSDGDRLMYRSGDQPSSSIDATARSAETGWEVTVRQDRVELDNALLVATGIQFGAVGIAILSVAVLGLWIARTTLGNISELIAGLNQFEAGNYDHAISLGATDEWTQIESQYNSLGETLAQRESQLRVLNRVLRHNLRNDMSVVIAHAETLLEDGDLSDPSKVETIRQTAYDLLQTSGHARTIYDDLLGDGTTTRRPIDLVEIVAADVEPLQDDFPHSCIETHLPESAWVLDGDTVPIVVDELCRNALEHNDRPESERVLSVTVEPAADGVVRLDVRDNGPGFPAVESEILTGDCEETAIEHGSGLGLWVVNWLVTRLGGDVRIRAASDRGSVVSVRLPAADAPPDVE